MRLIRFGEKGNEKPGLWKDGAIVDLTEIFPEIPDIGARFFNDGWTEKISRVETPARTMDVRLGAPVVNPSKIICLGKNYAEHAKEGGFDSPSRPLLFSKAPTALNGPFDPIVLPRSSRQIDWEVELAVVIGRAAKRVAADEAIDVIAGVTVANDVSGRDAQFADSQWFRGKSFDTFAPMGPALVTLDEIEDLRELELTARVNGELMQRGWVRDMIFDIPAIIENISEDISLLPGDVIMTGTPAGVGFFRDPPVLLQHGHIVECTIAGIGTIRNTCIAQQE
ncbi:2-hydroxyhepta-2,4-diene-1,7-dioate isomerase [Olavius algarvensis associated proteobacterium Delta 3]|nr:2-hydroxyhepta-2,4-diene-1,7-dioate isomerase [Olavius algarvensis associated proteobacterium Delta 3]CAB5163137.1 2-hydroxyhepta-2,4-diene-1,7-dioate isomerase [Olavius algarvensis associated proteobacterium Delta 3]